MNGPLFILYWLHEWVSILQSHFVNSTLKFSFFQVGRFSYNEDGSEEMESLRNQKIEEETENFVIEESGHEYNNRPDVKKKCYDKC